MESANLWAQIAGDEGEGVRIADEADIGAITRLLREAPYSHIHADWHFPADWLGLPTFVVAPISSSENEKRTFSARLFGSQKSLAGCLAVTADPKPAAWVRIAAVAEKARGRELLASMLSAVLDPLQEDRITQIAWLLVEEWPELWLPDLGFEKINEVITYSKFGTKSPPISRPSGLVIRSVESADLAVLAEIESRAFEPLWRHSAWGLALARQHTISFDVAEIGQKVVGFQFSSSTLRGAHLSRITVDPAVQNSGIGSALLAHALDGYARQGISQVTLNTQLDNVASQKLYERFGFQQSGERFPVWNLPLSRER